MEDENRALDNSQPLPRQGWRSLTHRLQIWLPTPGNMLFTLLVVGILLSAQNAGAMTLNAPAAAVTSTNIIPYQGRLADAAGGPLNGTIAMSFRLYAAASGGSALWTEQWTTSNSVQVNDGLFSVMLGSITAIPQNVLTTNNNLFLGITVGTDAEMTPRVQLGTVPYAVQALTVPNGSITTAKLAPDISLVPSDNSITTAKLQDGSVTTKKMSRTLVTAAPAGNIALTNADTLYDVISTTINLDQNTLITINATAGLEHATLDGGFWMEVHVDGSSIISSHRWQKAGMSDTHSVSTSLMLGPGSHIIKLKAGCKNNNGLVAGDTRTQMSIIEG